MKFCSPATLLTVNRPKNLLLWCISSIDNKIIHLSLICFYFTCLMKWIHLDICMVRTMIRRMPVQSKHCQIKLDILLQLVYDWNNFCTIFFCRLIFQCKRSRNKVILDINSNESRFFTDVLEKVRMRFQICF